MLGRSCLQRVSLWSPGLQRSRWLFGCCLRVSALGSQIGYLCTTWCLQGTIQYQRLPLGLPRTDPFNGLYLASYGEHGPELLRVYRETVDGEELVLAQKLTGAPLVAPGLLVCLAVDWEHVELRSGVWAARGLGVVSVPEQAPYALRVCLCNT